MSLLPVSRVISIVLDKNELTQSLLETRIRHALDVSGYPSLDTVNGQLISIDLTQCFWYDLGSLLWLLMLLNRLKQRGNDLELLLPERNSPKGEGTWSFLHRWRFFHALAEFVDDPLNLLPLEQAASLNVPGKYSRGSVRKGERGG